MNTLTQLLTQGHIFLCACAHWYILLARCLFVLPAYIKAYGRTQELTETGGGKMELELEAGDCSHLWTKNVYSPNCASRLLPPAGIPNLFPRVWASAWKQPYDNPWFREGGSPFPHYHVQNVVLTEYLEGKCHVITFCSISEYSGLKVSFKCNVKDVQIAF